MLRLLNVFTNGGVKKIAFVAILLVTLSVPALIFGQGSFLNTPHLSFDGSNDKVDLQNLDISGSALTLEVNFNSSDLDNCGSYLDCRIISKSVGTADQDHYWMLSTIKNSSNQAVLRFRLKTGSSTSTLIASSAVVNENEWNHVAATYDGSMMRLYLNGNEVGSAPKSGNLATNSSVNAYIGNNPVTSKPFEGLIDDVRIWNIARTQSEISDSREAELTGSESGLVGYWRFNEGEGQFAHDSSGNLNDGILGDAVSVDSADPVWLNLAADVEPPTQVTNVTADVISSNQVNLDWDVSSDDRAVTQYVVERNQVEIAAVSSNDFVDTGLSELTTYEYVIYAEDEAGNRSVGSEAISVQTPVAPDTEAPTVPQNLQAVEVNESQVDLAWEESTDNVSVTHYNVLRDGALLETIVAANTYTDLTVTPGVTYTYAVNAVDAAGNTSADSNTVQTLIPTPPDNDPPTTPQNLQIVSSTDEEVNLDWDDSTDNVVVLRYLVVRDGVQIAEAPNSSFTDTEFTIGVEHTYEVYAEDASSNISAVSNQVSVTVLDTTNPELEIVNPTSGQYLTGTIALHADATDNVAVDYVRISIDDVEVHTAFDAPFTFDWDSTTVPDGEHTISFEAFDTSGNSNLASSTHTVINDFSAVPLPGGQHVVFDGNNDRINLGALEVGSNSLTLEAWFRSDDLGNCSSNDCRILTKASGVNTNDHTWMLSTIKSGSSTNMRFRLKTNGSTETLISNQNVPESEWVHVAATYDGSQMRIYQNGQLVGQQNETGSITSEPSKQAWIGSSPNSGLRPWLGEVDDVRIWNVARSQQEIADNMNYELTGVEDGLFAYYKLNEGGGQLAYDATGNQSNGIIGSTDQVDDNDPAWGLEAPDTEAPSSPGNLQSGSVTDNSFTLDWQASTDNVAVTAYEVVIDGVVREVIGTQTSYLVDSLQPSTEYIALVRAYDAAGNLSSDSNQVIVTTTTPDTTAPVVSIDSPLDSAELTGIVDVTLTASDDQSLDYVEVILDGSVLETLTSGPFIYSWNTATVSNGLHDLSARAVDSSGNETSTSTIVVDVQNTTPPVNALPGSQHLVFDGSNDRVDLGNIDIPGNQMTLEAWVNSSDLSNCAARDCRIIAKATGVNDQDHYWMVSTIQDGGNTALRFRLKTNGNTSTLVSSSNVPENSWVHIAATYDGSAMRLYQDGNLVGTTSKSGSITTASTVPAWLGDSPVGNRPWQGAIDDVRIWTVARSQAEISQAMNQELTGLEDNLFAYYKLNEGGGQTAVDSGSNGLDGVLGSSTNSDSADPTYGIETPDVQSPTTPQNVVVANAYSTQIDLTWDESFDDRIVAGYIVLRDGVEVGNVDTNSFTDISVSPQTSYSYQIVAYDGADNQSDASSATNAATSEVMPITFSGVQVDSVSTDKATISWQTNDTASGKIEYGITTSYGSETSESANLQASHTQELTDLAADTVYHFRIVSTNSSGTYTSEDYTFTTSGNIVIGGEFGFEYETISDVSGTGGRTAISDIDGDGYNDVVVHTWATNRGNDDNGTLIWYKYPDWTPTTVLDNTNFFGDGIIAADLDADGDMDIITCKGSDSDPSIYWYENPGDGSGNWNESFVLKMETGSEVKDIEVHDMDHDGKLDIVGRSKHRTTIMYQDNPQSWDVRETITQEREGMMLGDVDHDGDEDIIINGWWLENPGVRATDQLEIHDFDSTWNGQSGGSFRDNAVMISTGDYDGDGDEDFAVSHAEHPGYTAAWYEAVDPKAGESGFIKHPIATVDYGHNNASADFDLDGDVDILIGTTTWAGSSNKISVFLNDGTGENWTEHVMWNTAGYKGVIGDIDNDGDMDFTSSRNWETHPVYVLRNTSDPVFRPTDPALDMWERHEVDQMAWRGVFVEHADLDGDGDEDVASAGWWYENPGELSGQWIEHTIGSPLNNLGAIYDFDGDGDMDILGTEGQGSTSNRNLVWAENDGSGNFTVRTNINTGGSGDFLQGVAVDRFTDAGPLQVAMSWHNGGGGVQMLTVPSNPSTEQWTWQQISSTTQGEQLTAGDIDQDGDRDLLLGTIWLENNSGVWTPHVMYEPSGIDNTPDRSRLADMNGDGRLDAVVGFEAISIPGRLAWYEQPADPTGTWTEHIIDETIIGPMSLDVLDMDYDGDIEVVAGEHNLANTSAARLFVYENINGDSTEWTQHVVYTGDEHHDGAQIADLDNDGDYDIVSIGWGARRVTVYENTTPVAGAWWSDAHSFRLPLTFSPDDQQRQDYVVETNLNFTDQFNQANSPGALIEDSIRVVETDENGFVINSSVAHQFIPSSDYDASTNAAGTLALLLPGVTSADESRYFDVYFDHSGAFPAINFTDLVSVTDDVQDEGQASFEVVTPNATWLYQKDAGGFSSIIDSDGNDWIGYSTATGSAGEFRGIPNLVYPEGQFHPGATGSTSTLVTDGPLKTTIHTTTNDDAWEAYWHIYPTHAQLQVVKTNHSYWFLYEGTPGGQLDYTNDSVTLSNGQVYGADQTFHFDFDGEEWAYVSDAAVNRSIFLVHHEDDNEIDGYRPMNNQMTVFGFGRGAGTATYMDNTPQHFSVGLMDLVDYQNGSEVVRGSFYQYSITNSPVESR